MSASSSSSDKSPSSSFEAGSAPICTPSCAGSSERSDKVQLSLDCRRLDSGGELGKGNEGPRRRRLGEISTGDKGPRSGMSSARRLPPLALFGWGGLPRGGVNGGVLSLLEAARAFGVLADLVWFRPKSSSFETNLAHALASGVVSPLLGPGPRHALVGGVDRPSAFDHSVETSLRSPGLFGDLGLLGDRFRGLARPVGSMATGSLTRLSTIYFVAADAESFYHKRQPTETVD